MSEVWLDPEPYDALAELAADPTRAVLHEAIESVLDALQQGSSAPALRRRFLDPPLWCVFVAAPTERWVILWEPHPLRPWLCVT